MFLKRNQFILSVTRATSEYSQNFIHSLCMKYFQCHLVTYLQDLYIDGVLHLSKDESSYVSLVVGSHCNGRYITSTSFMYSFSFLYPCLYVYGAIFTFNLIFPMFFEFHHCVRFARWLNIIFIITTVILGLCLYFGPVLCIYELNIKNACYLRILEIVLKLLCKFVILLISITLLYALEKLLRLSSFIIVNSLIAVVVLVWPIVIIFIPPLHYCCQFIPVCV